MNSEKIHISVANEEDEYYFKEGCYILEQLNTEQDPEASIARARVLPGATTRWHQLINTTERYVIQSGCGLVEVGQCAHPVSEGDIVLIPAGMRQRIQNTGDTDLIFLAVCTPRFERLSYIDLEAPANKI